MELWGVEERGGGEWGAVSLFPSFCAYQTQTFLLTSDHKRPPGGEASRIQMQTTTSSLQAHDRPSYKNWKVKDWK